MEQKSRNPIKKWKEKEELLILEYLKEIIQDNKEVEKPTAKIFYNKMIEKLHLNANATQLKTKVNHLKKSFSKAVEWENGTGQGVLEGSVADYISYICPHYDILFEIFGNKTNIQPPYIYDSCIENECQEMNSTEAYYQYEIVNKAFASGGNDENDLVDDSDISSQIVTNSTKKKKISTKLQKEVSVESEENCVNFDDVDLIDDSNRETLFSPNQKEVLDKTFDGSQPIKKFKKYLSNSSKPRNQNKNASSFLSELQDKRFEAMKNKNEIEKLKVENEKQLKEAENQLARDKFEFEKDLKIKEMNKKYEIDLEIKKKEIESNERIEKMKIDLALALAKIAQQNKD